jgi:hypothetical protein
VKPLLSVTVHCVGDVVDEAVAVDISAGQPVRELILLVRARQPKIRGQPAGRTT